MKMFMRFTAATMFFLLCLPCASAQSADDAIVLSIIKIGTASDDLYASERARLDQAIIDASNDAGRYEVKVAIQDLSQVRDGFSCLDIGYTKCMAEVGKLQSAEQILWGELAQQSGQWDLSLNVMDVTTKRIVHQKAWAFPAAEGALDDMVLAVRGFIDGKKTQKAKPKGRVRIESDPAGATVRVDGTVYRETPATLTLEAGPHKAEVSVVERGRKTRKKTRNFTVRPGQEIRLPIFRFTEKPQPKVGTELAPAKKKNWRFWTGVSAMTIATVSGVSAMYFLGEQEAAASEANTLIKSATVDPATGSDGYTQLQIDAHAEIEADYNRARMGLIISSTIAGIAAASGTYLIFVSDTTTTAVIPTLGGISVHATF